MAHHPRVTEALRELRSFSNESSSARVPAEDICGLAEVQPRADDLSLGLRTVQVEAQRRRHLPTVGMPGVEEQEGVIHIGAHPYERIPMPIRQVASTLHPPEVILERACLRERPGETTHGPDGEGGL